MPFDHARNAICDHALSIGVEQVFMLDSDVIPPNDVILRLQKWSLPIVSGMYCRRSPPATVPVAIKNGTWLQEVPPPNHPYPLVEVDVVGAGCLLIQTNLLRDLPPITPEFGKRWFDWRVDRQHLYPPGEALSEDFSFNVHCRKNGIPIYLDTSIRCHHVGFSEANLGTLAPCEVRSLT